MKFSLSTCSVSFFKIIYIYLFIYFITVALTTVNVPYHPCPDYPGPVRGAKIMLFNAGRSPPFVIHLSPLGVNPWFHLSSFSCGCRNYLTFLISATTILVLTLTISSSFCVTEVILLTGLLNSGLLIHHVHIILFQIFLFIKSCPSN